jgi:hypothetical protein
MAYLIRSISLLALYLLSAAAHSNSAIEKNTELESPVTKVEIIRTPNPVEYRMEFSLHKAVAAVSWVPLLVNKGRNSSLSTQLSNALVGRNLNLNELLRSKVEKEIENAGFQIDEAPKVDGIDPSKPWNVDYKTIKSGGNALLHVYIERIGVQSRSESSVYLPFAHIYYCLIIPGNKNRCAYSKRSYYGEGITSEGVLAYPADLTYQWTDSDSVFANISQVESSLKNAVLKVGEGISESIIRNLEEVTAHQN